jgi:hypothetical protein
MDIYLGIFLFFLANIFAWLQFNSQFAWDWWSDKPLLSVAIYAMPMSYIFWHAIKYIVTATGEVWSSKIIGFALGNVVFAFMTYFILNESIFTGKTMTCLLLSAVILMIQVLWK